jgi:uncharacterized protein (DUF486 family)
MPYFRLVWPLKFREVTLWQVILISWMIALPEYALQVPANHMSYSQFNATQLKAIREINYAHSFLLILNFLFRRKIKVESLGGVLLDHYCGFSELKA